MKSLKIGWLNVFFPIFFVGVMIAMEYLPDGFSVLKLVISILLVIIALITAALNGIWLATSGKNKEEKSADDIRRKQ